MDMFNFRRIKGDELIEGIKQYIDKIQKRINELEERVRTFSKDEEIQKITKELLETRRNSLVIMSEKERNSAKDFSSKHYSSCGSKSIYIIEGTGIGTITTIKCKKCETEQNITDMSNW